MMAINLNPLLVNALAGFASNSMPNLNLKPVVWDVGAQNRGMAAGLLAQAERQLQYDQLANAIAKQQLTNQGQLEREAYKQAATSERQQAINENQMNMQKMRTGFDYDKLAVNTDTDYRKMASQENIAGLDRASRENIAGQRLGADTAYRNKRLSLEEQKMAQQAVMDEFNRTFKLDEQRYTLKKDLNNNFFGLYKQLKTDEEKESAKQLYLQQAAKSGLMDPIELRELQDKSPQEIYQLTGIQGRIADVVGNMKQNPSIQEQYTANIIKQQGDANSIVNKLRDSREANQTLINTATQSLEILEKINPGYAGPIANVLSPTNEEAQKFKGLQADLTLFLKEAKNMGSQGFTDKDREFLAQIPGDLSQYKGSIKFLLERLRSVAQASNAIKWRREYEYTRQGDPQLVEQFLQQYPEPIYIVKEESSGETAEIPAITYFNNYANKKGYKVVGYGQ
jgi:hypothetical protein